MYFISSSSNAMLLVVLVLRSKLTMFEGGLLLGDGWFWVLAL